MDRRHSRSLFQALVALATGGSMACTAGGPQLGQSPTRDVIAAMTREEKISLVMGTAMGYVNVKFMTWLQSWIEGKMMGRVMSLLTFASVGVAPVSSAIAGAILDINYAWLFIGAGAAVDVVVLLSAMTPTIRHMGMVEAGDGEGCESMAAAEQAAK